MERKRRGQTEQNQRCKSIFRLVSTSHLPCYENQHWHDIEWPTFWCSLRNPSQLQDAVVSRQAEKRNIPCYTSRRRAKNSFYHRLLYINYPQITEPGRKGWCVMRDATLKTNYRDRPGRSDVYRHFKQALNFGKDPRPPPSLHPTFPHQSPVGFSHHDKSLLSSVCMAPICFQHWVTLVLPLTYTRRSSSFCATCTWPLDTAWCKAVLPVCDITRCEKIIRNT